MARPATVDDVGTDLFCTLFNVVTTATHEALVPRNSIAVQIKSSPGAVDVTKNLDYLSRLEVPYYLGIVNRRDLSLALYSARYLPLLLALVGKPRPLRLVPSDSFVAEYRRGDEEHGYELICPRVGVFHASDEREALATMVAALQTDAEEALKAIVSRLNEEYIFDRPDGSVEIFAGMGSASVLHSNFTRRLAEALYNLAWMGPQARPDDVDFYLRIFTALEARNETPPYLRVAKAELDRARTEVVGRR